MVQREECVYMPVEVYKMVREGDMSAEELVLYLVIDGLQWEGADGCTSGDANLADLCSVSVRAVRKNIDGLEQLAVLSVGFDQNDHRFMVTRYAKDTHDG